MNKIEFGDCRDTMRRWANDGVKAQMCVTSPPYFGLRDYGTGTWEGGDPSCTHTPSGLDADNKNLRAAAPNGKPSARDAAIIRGQCPCGARKVDRQLGLEQTPEQYIAAMVEVFRCVKDVLADDGTLWLNIGDSYARAGGWSDNSGLDGLKRGESGRAKSNMTGEGGASQKLPPNLKNKDLIGIPWMLAFALRADGWYLRQDIIWSKPNPMPESVRDRCTKAHEYIFLLSKSEKYFFDSEAIKEPLAEASIGRAERKQRLMDRAGVGTLGKQIVDGVDATHAYAGLALGRNGKTGYDLESGLRNKRSVWTVATRPYQGAHFATFPPALIEPCILAGSRPGDIVLDPFMGSGTTAAVSLQHGRQYLGCELNPEYGPLQEQRITQAKPTPDLFS
jgi:DNA modification methylase